MKELIAILDLPRDFVHRLDAWARNDSDQFRDLVQTARKQLLRADEH